MLKRLEALGVHFVVENENVKARSDGPMPEEAKRLILNNKDTLREQVLARERRLREYVARAVQQAKREGVAYVYSNVLGEQVAFVKDGLERRVKPGMVVYTLSELNGLMEANSTAWNMLHQAKKLFGGRVVAVKGKEGYNGTKPRSA